ncbi:hypothetical protein BC938DRAFT_480828 [Jimgerdemannia flammicorona]|uniref:Uncharacterized protein n=1 Tax=Jimgerdemannia flammicorona TaxID=994334 RepID=A0A433QHL7_9FUNG|nr:hypothetical protein BC938DRAFT_480828 [Jimgerdemannia flammicorona]
MTTDGRLSEYDRYKDNRRHASPSSTSFPGIASCPVLIRCSAVRRRSMLNRRQVVNSRPAYLDDGSRQAIMCRVSFEFGDFKKLNAASPSSRFPVLECLQDNFP